MEEGMEAKEWKLRYLLLLCDCLIGFGCYFNIDLPSALQSEIEGTTTGNCTTGNGSHCCEDCLGLDAEHYNNLYVVYLWMNSALALPMGYFIDRIGNRAAALLSTMTSLLGTVSFALALMPGFRRTALMFPLMILGRALLGAGNVSVRIVQDRVIAFWFPDRLELVFGVIVCVLRLGNVSNFLLTTNMSDWFSIQLAAWTGSVLCGLGFMAAVFLAVLDVLGSKKVPLYNTTQSTSLRLLDARSFPLAYWIIVAMIAFFYAAYIPLVANGCEYIQERFGYTETTASYINGASYDVAVFACPLVGVLLNRCCRRFTLATVGVFFLVPAFVLLLTTSVTPVIITGLLGVVYSLFAVSIWPSIAKTVPLQYVGTANGIANMVDGLFEGGSSFVVGLLQEKNDSDDKSFGVGRWHHTFIFLMSCAFVSFCCGVALNVVDKRQVTEKQRTIEVSPTDTTPSIQETERLLKDKLNYGAIDGS